METLRQKRQKPTLSLTYSYLCPLCDLIAEAPAGLTCPSCEQPMLSLSRLYKSYLKIVLKHIGHKKVGLGPLPETERAQFLTEFRD